MGTARRDEIRREQNCTQVFSHPPGWQLSVSHEDGTQTLRAALAAHDVVMMDLIVTQDARLGATGGVDARRKVDLRLRRHHLLDQIEHDEVDARHRSHVDLVGGDANTRTLSHLQLGHAVAEVERVLVDHASVVRHDPEGQDRDHDLLVTLMLHPKTEVPGIATGLIREDPHAVIVNIAERLDVPAVNRPFLTKTNGSRVRNEVRTGCRLTERLVGIGGDAEQDDSKCFEIEHCGCLLLERYIGWELCTASKLYACYILVAVQNTKTES